MTQQINTYIKVLDTTYEYDTRINQELSDLRQRVNVIRTLVGSLTHAFASRLQEYFRLRNIYNSNAIEGNTLTIGETRLVVQEGLTITGKPLEDTVEAINLSHALDYIEELARREGEPIRAVMECCQIRQ